MPLGILAAFLACAPVGSAFGCRVPRAPFVPRPDNGLTIAIAQIVARGPETTILQVDEYLSGRRLGRLLRLPYGTNDGIVVTSCGDHEPPLEVGARMIAVIYEDAGQIRLRGRTTLESAARNDPFFQLYLSTRDTSRRRRLRERWVEVATLRGPVPLTNPTRWARPFAGTMGWTTSQNATHALFRLGDDGRVSLCQISHASEPAERDGALCSMLRRQRFKRPLLPVEREGVYEVRWNERAAAGR